MDIRTAADAERHVTAIAAELTAPADDECVFCYTERMLFAFGCDTTLRWARHWRDLRRPRARGLERRLNAHGGFCDCEILLNGWMLRDDLQVPDDDGELVRPDPRPRCAGIGPRSSQPCSNWAPWRRPRW